VLRPTHRVGRVRRYDLADHHPIEEHSQRGETQLYSGLGMGLELRLDERRDVYRLHLGEISEVMLGAEDRELPNGLAVGAAGIGIADVRAEEIPHPCTGFGSRDEDRR
jgi:hypothetical protein